jgi:hypothetical protein
VRTAHKGVGVALSAMTFMMWTGVTASADDGISVADEAVSAIDAVASQPLENSIDVVSADSTITGGAGVSVELSSDAADGVSVDSPTAGEFEIGLPFAEAADRAEVVDGVVVYDNNNGSTTTPLVNDDGSVQILTTITDENAPTEYTYVVEAASAGGLVLSKDGGVDVVGADGFVVSHVLAPWAVDADGRSVPTRFVVDGSTLTQVVDHGLGVVYPVVANPKFTSTWWNKTLYFNMTESAVVASGGATAAWIAHYFGLPGSVISGVLAGYASAFGLYTATGKCGKLVFYVGYPAPVPQPYWVSEAGGYCK